MRPSIVVASLYVHLLITLNVPFDRRFVMWSSLGDVWLRLYYFNVSFHTVLIWMCFVSVRNSSVDLVGMFYMYCRSRMVLCMPLVLNIFMAGCRLNLVFSSLRMFAWGLVCVLGV